MKDKLEIQEVEKIPRRTNTQIHTEHVVINHGRQSQKMASSKREKQVMSSRDLQQDQQPASLQKPGRPESRETFV
jgi:hypothetical protein